MAEIRIPGDKKRFMALLFLASLLLRLALSPLQIQEPSLPFDFYSYIGGGKCFIGVLGGHYDCLQTLDSNFQNRYGPLFNLVMGLWIYVFGSSFLLLKFPSIIADSVTPLIIYLIALKFTRHDNAAYASLLYSTSYMTLLSAGVWGNDDSFFMAFMMASVLFILESKIIASVLSLAVSALFKATPLVLILPFFIFLWRAKGLKQAASYVAAFSVVFCILYSPYAYVAGRVALIPFTAPSSWGLDGLSPLNLVKLSYALPYHVLHPELPRSFSSQDPSDPWNLWGNTLFAKIMRIISLPFTLLGVVLYLLYVKKYKLENPGLELLRNIILVMMVFLFFSKAIYSSYYLWFYPFLLLVYSRKPDFSLVTRGMWNGFVMVLAASFLYASVFMWSDNMSTFQMVLIYLGVLLAVYGTYLTLGRFEAEARSCVTLLLLVFSLDILNLGRILMIFYPLLRGFASYELARLLAYYAGYYINIVLNVAAFIWLFLVLHRTRD